MTYRIPYQHELKMNHLDHRHRQALLHPWPAQLPSTWHLVMAKEHCCYPYSPCWDLMAKDPILGHWEPHLTPQDMICFAMLPNIDTGKTLVLVSDCFSLHSPLPVFVTLFPHLQNQGNALKLLYNLLWALWKVSLRHYCSTGHTGLKAVGSKLYKHYMRFKPVKCEEQSICKVTATALGFPLSCDIQHKKPNLNGNGLQINHCFLMERKGKITCIHVHSHHLQGELDSGCQDLGCMLHTPDMGTRGP